MKRGGKINFAVHAPAFHNSPGQRCNQPRFDRNDRKRTNRSARTISGSTRAGSDHLHATTPEARV